MNINKAKKDKCSTWLHFLILFSVLTETIRKRKVTGGNVERNFYYSLDFYLEVFIDN